MAASYESTSTLGAKSIRKPKMQSFRAFPGPSASRRRRWTPRSSSGSPRINNRKGVIMTGRKSFIAALAAAGLAFGATPALAYIGPGAGLSLLGALWGVVAAVAAALLFLLLWPLRRLDRTNNRLNSS